MSLYNREEVTPQATDIELTAIRRRLVYVLFSGATLGWVAFVATLTVATVAARSLSGSTALAGFPLAAGALGQALGTNLFGKVERPVWAALHHVDGPAHLGIRSHTGASGSGLRLVLDAGCWGVIRGWGPWVDPPDQVCRRRTERGAPARLGGGDPGVVGHRRIAGGSQPCGRGGSNGGRLAGYPLRRRFLAGRHCLPALLVDLLEGPSSRPFPSGRHHPGRTSRQGLGGLGAASPLGAALHIGSVVRAGDDGAGDDRHSSADRGCRRWSDHCGFGALDPRGGNVRIRSLGGKAG